MISDIDKYKNVIWRHCLVLIQQALDQLTNVNNYLQSTEGSRTLVSSDTISVEYRSNAYTAVTSLESGVHIMYMLCDIFQENIKPCIETPESRDLIILCYTVKIILLFVSKKILCFVLFSRIRKLLKMKEFMAMSNMIASVCLVTYSAIHPSSLVCVSLL
jgi:hypothetical protein